MKTLVLVQKGSKIRRQVVSEKPQITLSGVSASYTVEETTVQSDCAKIIAWSNELLVLTHIILTASYGPCVLGHDDILNFPRNCNIRTHLIAVEGSLLHRMCNIIAQRCRNPTRPISIERYR